MLIWPPSAPPPDRDMFEGMGPKSPLATFLKDFGPVLLEKYKPKAILVFSAHWETSGERLGTIRLEISTVCLTDEFNQ